MGQYTGVFERLAIPRVGDVDQPRVVALGQGGCCGCVGVGAARWIGSDQFECGSKACPLVLHPSEMFDQVRHPGYEVAIRYPNVERSLIVLRPKHQPRTVVPEKSPSALHDGTPIRGPSVLLKNRE